ncbi:MAG: hypothetical protein JWM79_1012 [Nocardioides sp.]|nr:hypothetical protein [Nocardioides sp.]
MNRRLKELDRLDGEHGLGASPTHAPTGRGRRPPRIRTPRRGGGTTRQSLGGPLLPSLVIALVLSTFIMLRDPGLGGYRLRHLLGLDDRVSEVVHPPAARGHFAFSLTQPGSRQPVSWNPCESIPYVVNPDGAPDGWQALVDASTADLEKATGFKFQDNGTTDDRDFQNRTGMFGKPEPVLIGWATEDEVPELAGDVAGLGGSAAIESRPGHLSYVTGMVALDRGLFQELDAAGDPTPMRAILDHELGHVVGLAHVDDPNELMYGDTLARSTFGPGDLQGLAKVGAVSCA